MDIATQDLRMMKSLINYSCNCEYWHILDICTFSRNFLKNILMVSFLKFSMDFKVIVYLFDNRYHILIEIHKYNFLFLV